MHQINVTLSENQMREAEKGKTNLRLKTQTSLGLTLCKLEKENSTNGKKLEKKEQAV